MVDPQDAREAACRVAGVLDALRADGARWDGAGPLDQTYRRLLPAVAALVELAGPDENNGAGPEPELPPSWRRDWPGSTV